MRNEIVDFEERPGVFLEVSVVFLFLCQFDGEESSSTLGVHHRRAQS